MLYAVKDNNCPLGMLFGGQRFILFMIYDAQEDTEIHHPMMCSKTYQTGPTDGSASAIQVTAAALFGPKNTSSAQLWSSGAAAVALLLEMTTTQKKTLMMSRHSRSWL